MGQQQLLLIILGVIVVGLAVAVGITMFADRAISSNREALLNDLTVLANRAQQYYRRPSALGGGERTFVGLPANASGLAKLTFAPKNDNGSFSIVTDGTATTLRIQGLGTEVGNDDINPVKLTMDVYPDSVVVLTEAASWN